MPHEPIPSADVAPEDERFMKLALEEARAALERGSPQAEDVPVGAVLVDASSGEPIGRGRNVREAEQDPVGHAEIVALREGARTRGRWRLEGTTLYATLEPCAMCAGALVNARVTRLVYGAKDPRAGAAGSILDICRDPRLNHRLVVVGGVLEAEAAELLRSFFRARRGAADSFSR